MSTATPTENLCSRFSEPTAGATPWPDADAALARAELYWLTTVRADGRPHVTPLVGVWVEQAFYFATGFDEQKARNLEANHRVAVTTGQNTWAEGLDAVVEGTAVRVTGAQRLRAVADAYRAKYGNAWNFDTDDEVFSPGDQPAALFEVRPHKVLAFAKHPHAQTRYRFTDPAARPA